jgi:divalent metal cation (Fe/Co/Zn/Cd) transporter
LVTYTGWLWMDALVAIGVALNILKEGWHLIWTASQGLMDEALEPDVQARIFHVLQELSLNREEEGGPTVKVIHFDHVITRKAGQRRFVDLHMHMPAEWTLGHAASLRGNVEQTLMQTVPGLRVTIQLLPIGVEAHLDDPIR